MYTADEVNWVGRKILKYEFTDFKFTKIAGPKKRELRGNTVSTYVLCGLCSVFPEL